MKSLEERVAAIETRQRLYQQHDPECIAFQSEDLYQCNCWLAERMAQFTHPQLDDLFARAAATGYSELEIDGHTVALTIKGVDE